MATKKHKSYNTIKMLIDGNQLHEFREIFDHIPKTTIYRDLGINYDRFTEIIVKVQGFKLEELYTLSRLIGVDEKVMVDLAHNQYMADKKKKSKNSAKNES